MSLASYHSAALAAAHVEPSMRSWTTKHSYHVFLGWICANEYLVLVTFQSYIIVYRQATEAFSASYKFHGHTR